MEDIGRYCSAIDLILSQDGVDLLLHNNLVLTGVDNDIQAVKSTTNAVQIDGKDTNMRVKNIETMSTVALPDIQERLKRVELQGEKRQQGEEEAKKEKILAWLSPLYIEYVLKQQRLVEECYLPSCQWFLDSEEFAGWSQGNRPWQLECFGVAGSGKVRFHFIHRGLC